MDMDVFEELSEPSRRYLLKEMLDGPRNVSQLVESTGLKQPNVSNHLSRLRSRGWVRASKVGRQVYYSLARADIDEAIRNYLNVERLRREDVDLHALSKEYAKAAIKGNELACAEIVEKTDKEGLYNINGRKMFIAYGVDSLFQLEAGLVGLN